MNFIRIFSFILITLMVFSCSSKKKDEDVMRPIEEIYNSGMDKLADKKYKKAIEEFEEIERTYPYSTWATKAQIMAAYANFSNEEYTDAIVVLDKFISLHPGNKDAEYAYYLKAICYYQQISDVTRDQNYSTLSYSALKEVIARFPEGKYARDAAGKLDLVQDYLAGKEVDVGRFYLKQRKYIAAINRFREVIEKYQTTSYVPEALHRLVEANIALGLKEEAFKYASVLGYNYPGSKWYSYSYKLIEGKKPDVSPENNIIKQWLDKTQNPFKKLKKQPNLVNEIPQTQPVDSQRDVIEEQLTVKPAQRTGVLNKIWQWFNPNIKK